MKKHYCYALSILIFLAIALICLAQEDANQNKPPDIVVSPSCAGEVSFPHKLHAEDFEIECRECHHAINAAELNIPHEEYFDDFWLDCKTCHRNTKSGAQSCSNCHHSSPIDVADETLSSKVVIHKNCWQCHETGKGEEASTSCKFCHTGAKQQH